MDYATFRQQYEEQHPASVPRLNPGMETYPSWLRLAALIVFIAVSVVSGAHTISTMRLSLIESLGLHENAKDPVSIAAFIGFEGFLFISVFSWQRKSHRWIAYGSTGVVYFVIVLANINDVLRSMGTGDIINGLFIAGVGIGVPTVALASGKMFVDIYQSKRQSASAAEERYNEACIAWDEEIHKAWEKHQRSNKERPVQPVHEASASRPQASIRQRNADHPQTVRRHLETHDEDLELSVRDLSRKLNIPRSTVGNVMQEFKAMQSNGHVNGHKQS